ncbi:MAG: CCA tRNA nucleotidyltransferase, partial [Anaerolineales bacterium]|nr:CCA tRNA nucleotidyltransferase [Anaerolineales bacterium]
IKLDLHRRDFTINTLALRLDGRHYGDLHDYWGGVSDLQNGLIRVLHSLSFVDDPTRILRAVRFEQRFNFQIEDRTLELLQAALPLLDRVSGDRVRHELNAILREDHHLAMLDRLAELDVIPAIHPELVWSAPVRALLAELQTEALEPEWGLDELDATAELQRDLSYVLWLSHLAADKAQAVGQRLRLPQALLAVIAEAQSILSDLESIEGRQPSAVVARLEKVPHLAIYAAYLRTGDEEIKTALHTYVQEWQHITPSLDGHDLRERGLPPGPHYRQILNALRDAWVDGRVSSTTEEQSLLEKLIQEYTPTREQPEESEH